MDQGLDYAAAFVGEKLRYFNSLWRFCFQFGSSCVRVFSKSESLERQRATDAAARFGHIVMKSSHFPHFSREGANGN
jgi:hypothetical protein